MHLKKIIGITSAILRTVFNILPCQINSVALRI